MYGPSRYLLAGALWTISLTAAGSGCTGSATETPVPDGARDGARADGAQRDGAAFLDAPPDRLIVPERLTDGEPDRFPHYDFGVDCGSWSNWYCQGQYPNYEAVCPPGLHSSRIIRCVLDGVCTCEILGVSPEAQCGYMPVPRGGKICSSFEQIFAKGCCKP